MRTFSLLLLHPVLFPRERREKLLLRWFLLLGTLLYGSFLSLLLRHKQNKGKASPLFNGIFSSFLQVFSSLKTTIFPRQNLLSRKQSVCQYCFSTRKKLVSLGLTPSINLGLGLQNLKQYKQSLAA